MMFFLQLPDPASMGIGSEMSPVKQQFVNNGGASPLAKQVMKKSFGTPSKSPAKKGLFSGTSKSPGKSPLKNLSKESGKDTPFSSKVFKEWRNKFASKDENGFHCLVCPKSFTLDSSLKRHYKNVHELVCKCCNMQFAEEHLLKAHHKEKHEYWCLPCNKVFTLRSSLIRHNVQQHGAESPRKEGKIKTDPDNMMAGKLEAQHIFNPPHIDPSVVIPPVDIDYQGLRHEDIAEDPAEDEAPNGVGIVKEETEYNEYFEGEINDAEEYDASNGLDEGEVSNLGSYYQDTDFETKPNVSMINSRPSKKPRNSQNEGEGSFPCPECEKIFANKGNMNRHYNSTHVFPCKVCKQKFVEKHLMEAHHFDEHVMHCPVCKKTFSNKGNLNRHMKQSHGQELPSDYQEPTQGKVSKQATPTKPKTAVAQRLKSPNSKQGTTTLSFQQVNQKLPLPPSLLNQTHRMPVPQPSNTNLQFSNQPQMLNHVSPNHQMYNTGIPQEMSQPNWTGNERNMAHGWPQ